ncbi:MAG: S26 family signal peptidase [Ruminococcus sp.]|nr:S26 family signal peptidase [Ruminococcus sp.]
MEKLSFEDILKKSGSLIYTNKGKSMMPLLKEGRDLFVVKRLDNRKLSRYDVIMFRHRRLRNTYVLHRIIKVTEKGYITRGDNCLKADGIIKDDEIIGVMTDFARKGKQYSTENFLYRVYSRLIVYLHFERVIKFSLLSVIGKIKNFIK